MVEREAQIMALLVEEDLREMVLVVVGVPTVRHLLMVLKVEIQAAHLNVLAVLVVAVELQDIVVALVVVPLVVLVVHCLEILVLVMQHQHIQVMRLEIHLVFLVEVQHREQEDLFKKLLEDLLLVILQWR